MKQIIALSLFLTFSASASAEQSWWDSLLSAVGLGDTEQVAEASSEKASDDVSVDGLLDMITSNLGVTKEQAQGGMAALFNYAKENISAEQFATLSQQIPGLESLMRYLPALSGSSEGGTGGLLDMAAGYSDKLGQLKDLKEQFDSLGLDPSMISEYAEQAQSYLDTPEGEKAKSILSDSIMNLSI